MAVPGSGRPFEMTTSLSEENGHGAGEGVPGNYSVFSVGFQPALECLSAIALK
jgi:hypothetical protein